MEENARIRTEGEPIHAENERLWAENDRLQGQLHRLFTQSSQNGQRSVADAEVAAGASEE